MRQEPSATGSFIDLVRAQEAALAASRESVTSLRECAAADPAAFQSNLAGALDTFGGRLYVVSLLVPERGLLQRGRFEEALAASEESVAIWRELAAADPAASQPGLARALGNLRNTLLKLGRREEALAASEESVAIWRELAVAGPATFQRNLALALNVLGLSGLLRRREDALAASEESVAIYRELAATDPAAFRSFLANALTNFSIRLAELGRHVEALAAAAESVAIYGELAPADPAAVAPNLGRALKNLEDRRTEIATRPANRKRSDDT